MNDPLLDSHQVAKALGVSHRSVERLVANGELAAIQIAGKNRFEPSTIDAYWVRKREEAEQARVTRARRRLKKRNTTNASHKTS